MLGNTFAVCSTVAGILSEGPGLNRPRQICPCLVWIEGCWEQKDCRVALLRMSVTVLRRPVCCKQLAHMYWGQLYSGYAAAPAVPDDVGQPASVSWYCLVTVQPACTVSFSMLGTDLNRMDCICHIVFFSCWHCSVLVAMKRVVGIMYLKQGSPARPGEYSWHMGAATARLQTVLERSTTVPPFSVG